MGRLEQKVALVTGAARGIGEAIATAFVREGARVFVSDIDEAAGRATARRLNAAWLHLDVRDEAHWIRAVAEVVDACGRLEVLVNNAGITGLETGSAHDPEHATLDDWRAVHRTNLDGVFLGCKHSLVAMRWLVGDGRRGSITAATDPAADDGLGSLGVARHGRRARAYKDVFTAPQRTQAVIRRRDVATIRRSLDAAPEHRR